MTKLFVLDTSVLLFDHNALNNFEDNNVAIPITVLEELDNFKVGNDSKNFEARAVIRFLDALSEDKSLTDWIPLGERRGKLKILLTKEADDVNATTVYGNTSNDNKIINAVLALQEQFPYGKVALVTKDINLRIKAKALGLDAQDYKNGQVQNIDHLVDETDIQVNNLDGKYIKALYDKKQISEDGILNGRAVSNGYYVLNNCSQSALARYNASAQALDLVSKSRAYGIIPKNVEQTFAMDALLNPAIQLVAIQGMAGTGKTLLALAAALEQKNLYDQIILSRPIIPLSNKDIGYLPGDAHDKISPYMQPLFDNLKFIKSQFKENTRKMRWIEEMEENGDLSITALAFIRGRSLANVMFIIDEAQNLTPHEIKTIITRAGEGTKIVFTGDIHQIDTPYLDKHSNGLSYIIDKFKGQEIFANVRLKKGERSELADLANKLL